MTSKLTIGAVIFDGFELLDLYGPLELLSYYDIITVAMQKGPVTSAQGPQTVAQTSFAKRDTFDILLIPGGPGTRTGVDDPAFIAALRQAADKATWVASVCTGAMLLAETGFLNKRPATTNKEAFAEIAEAYPDVEWQPSARWVQYGHLFTASGVSAGMDMSLALLTAIDGRGAADEMARLCEYIWNDNPQDDPFSKT